jgi:purine-binding chemotaxis protein CheW
LTDLEGTRASSLLCLAGGKACALPLSQVIETMRPLPVEAFPNAPMFVSGLALIRGEPLPVIDLSALLGVQHASVARFVTVKVAERRVALAVQAVLGVRDLSQALLVTLPPLLREANADRITAVGRLDSQLLFLLSSMQLVPAEALDELLRVQAASWESRDA